MSHCHPHNFSPPLHWYDSLIFTLGTGVGGSQIYEKDQAFATLLTCSNLCRCMWMQPIHNSNTIVKFEDDMTVIGLLAKKKKEKKERMHTGRRFANHWSSQMFYFSSIKNGRDVLTWCTHQKWLIFLIISSVQQHQFSIKYLRCTSQKKWGGQIAFYHRWRSVKEMRPCL